MLQDKKRIKTQIVVGKQIQKMLNMAAGEKLLPKIIYDSYVSTRKDPLLKEYRKSVKNLYTKQTHLPLKYNPQQARSHREKFRQKVLKVMNNEIPIDYLEIEKMKGKNVMTYKGHLLEEKKYKTKNQFSVFVDFNENKFKKGYSDFFQDKLQYEHSHIIRENQRTQKSKTIPNEAALYNTPDNQKKEISYSTTKKTRIQPIRRLITSQKLSNKKLTPLSGTVEKKAPLKIISKDWDQEILTKMKIIGSYPPDTPMPYVSLTKQSIVKYFRECYARPHRIIDFLEVGAVENFLSFKAIPHKMKLMPKDHIDFMVFLFYDSNNDGMICERDMLRIFELVKKCPLVIEDYNKLKKNSSRVFIRKKLKYKQLYKLSEITESAYFNWKCKNQDEKEEVNEELETYLRKMNQNKVSIDFSGFQKIYKNDKPFLWYDLMWRISGLTYDGLKYQ